MRVALALVRFAQTPKIRAILLHQRVVLICIRKRTLTRCVVTERGLQQIDAKTLRNMHRMVRFAIVLIDGQVALAGRFSCEKYLFKTDPSTVRSEDWLEVPVAVAPFSRSRHVLELKYIIRGRWIIDRGRQIDSDMGTVRVSCGII